MSGVIIFQVTFPSVLFIEIVAFAVKPSCRSVLESFSAFLSPTLVLVLEFVFW